MSVSQLNQPWKIEFKSEFPNSESAIYEWEDLRKPITYRKVLFQVGVLSVGFLLFLMAFILLQGKNQEVAISGGDSHPTHTPATVSGQVCNSAANAISAANHFPEPRVEVDFGGVKFQTVLLSCLDGQYKWWVEWVKTGGVWIPESATEAASAPQKSP